MSERAEPELPDGSFLNRSLLLFSIKLAGALLGFVGSIFLGRYLGIERFGQFELVLAVFNVLVILVFMGTDNALLRFVPQASNLSRRLVYLRMVLLVRVRLIGQVGVVLLLAALLDLLWQGESRDWVWMSAAACALVIPFAYREALSSFLVANHHNISAQLGSELLANAVRLLLLGMLVLTGVFNIYTALGAQFLGFSVSLVVLLLVCKKVYGSVSLYRSRAISPAFYRVARELWLASVFWHAMIYMDILMLGYFKDEALVGGYAVGLKLAQLLNYFVIVNNLIVGPRVSALYQAGDYPGLRKLMNVVMLSMFAVGVLALGFMVFAGEFLLGLWGAEFKAFTTVLIILVLGQVVNVMFNSHGALLGMTRYSDDLRRVIMAVLPLNILLNVLLIPRWGAEGAAVATSVTLLVVNLGLVVVARWRIFHYEQIKDS